MIRQFTILVIFLGLAGCTVLRPVDSPDRDQFREALLAASEWEFSGRIAVRSNTGQGDGQASLRWRQLDELSRIRISGPFGAHPYELVWTPERVSVSNADGEQSLEYRGPDAAEAFLQDQLGWSFPAGSARYWMLGLVDPNMPGEEHFDADGGLTGLSQHGWQLGFERYADVNGFLLPTRIKMLSPNASLRIVIGKWKLPLEAG